MSEQRLTAMPEPITTPQCYMRVNVTRNTKGYSYETTVSANWDASTANGKLIIAQLLRDADEVARQEITEREALDHVLNR